MSGSEFSTEAEISLTVTNQEIRSVRQTIEGGLSDIEIGISPDTSGGGGQQPRSPQTGQFMEIEGVEQRIIEQTELLDDHRDILDTVASAAEMTAEESGSSASVAASHLELSRKTLKQQRRSADLDAETGAHLTQLAELATERNDLLAEEGGRGGRQRRRQRREFRWARQRTEDIGDILTVLYEIEENVGGGGGGGIFSEVLDIGPDTGAAGALIGAAGALGGAATSLTGAAAALTGSDIVDLLSGDESVDIDEPLDAELTDGEVDVATTTLDVDDPSPLSVESVDAIPVDAPDSIPVDGPGTIGVEDTPDEIPVTLPDELFRDIPDSMRRLLPPDQLEGLSTFGIPILEPPFDVPIPVEDAEVSVSVGVGVGVGTRQQGNGDRVEELPFDDVPFLGGPPEEGSFNQKAEDFIRGITPGIDPRERNLPDDQGQGAANMTVDVSVDMGDMDVNVESNAEDVVDDAVDAVEQDMEDRIDELERRLEDQLRR